MSSSTPNQNQPSQDDWIRVTSRDGFSFIVKRSVVFRSGTLRNMLDERRTSPPRCLFVLHRQRDLFSPPRQLRRGHTKSLSRRRKVPILQAFLHLLRFLNPNGLRAAVTEKFVEFLAYKASYENVQPNEEIPDFFERIAPEIALELCVSESFLFSGFRN